ncbi:Os11g0649100 [Oryza sativa Japonica Group]|uniref:Os11g0649100 protein n=1 Tax=Oryza sativa subsp. japonica TaxID=39947 RepID=A0A0P0Y4W4_ORYSJ|nr:Os11g0649100 [Oryza sativa Japonica Group]
MGPKRRRKGKKKVGGAAAAAAGEEAAAARDEDAAGPSHAAAGEASSGAGGGADGGSPASRAASPPTTAAGGQGGGGPVSGGGGSAPGGAETAQRQGAPPAAVTSVQGAPRAPASTAATVPQGSPRRTVAAQSAPSGAAAMAQSAPGGSATGQTATAQSSPRAATSTQALMNEGFLHLDKSVSNNLEEEGPAFGDAQRRKKAIGVDNDDSNRDDADGGRDPNKSLSSEIVLSWTIQDILLDDEAHKSKAKTDCKMCDMSFDYEKIKLSHLNQQQLYSLKSIISAVHCRSNKHIELIQGPPGSGKTEITIALLQVLHHMNLKVLLCAPKTNIVKFLTNLDKCLFPLEDALVLDNLDSTELAKEFQRLCLCHRSQDFLVGITLFKKWLREMFVLLNLDPYCTEKCDHEPTRIRCSTNSLLVFTLSSFKEKFTKLLMRKEWLTNLKERFSEIYLSADIANDITNLLSLLKDFEDLLCHERLQDKRVQWTFGLSSVPCKLGGNSAARKLNDLRLQYVDFIQRFRSSLKLPKLEERKSLEDFCIKHAKVIISTTQSTFRLHEAAMEPINLFIVDDAAKINECDLIIPLRLPVTHILMLGDDFNLQPSKVWENARFSMNPFKRLLNLGFRKHMLTEQYAIHPSIWQFPNEKFYEGRITNGATVVSPEYNKQFKGLKFPNYCFIDVTGTDGPSCKNTIELATIQYMLKIISQGLEDTEVIDVGVLCLCGSYVGGIKSSLGKKYATHNKINVHIESADSFEGETYHLVILSMLFKDENTILQIEKINAALTRARHCLWMFGEVDSVSDRGGIFAELVHDVIERKCILKWNTITTIQSKYALESDNFHGSSSASSNETIHQDFSWILSTDNLKEEYENVVAKEIGSEEIEKKGKHRLATVLEILKEPGVLGSRKQQPEVVSNFKIKSHSQLPIKEDQEIKTVFDTVKDGKILVGHFHMSENFFSLRPGEIYHYDRQKPYLNPVSSLQASHAVMIIGSGVTMTKVKKRIQCAIHLSLQNSAGRLVGENGCGYVGLESIRGLYQLDI